MFLQKSLFVFILTCLYLHIEGTINTRAALRSKRYGDNIKDLGVRGALLKNKKLVAMIMLPKQQASNEDQTLRAGKDAKEGPCKTEECRKNYNHLMGDENIFIPFNKNNIFLEIAERYHLSQDEQFQLIQNWTFDCDARSAYFCRKSCYDAYRYACEDRSCDSTVRRRMKRGCRKYCGTDEDYIL